ncbi:MAG TPA: bifunctional phosphoribosylaminoimidazolecarboxamide formyltransferase/inosine monophosphate cyclohydrolase [Ktedonobacterales bacterium]|nr:bifunctional phosphoribosylaminoimidazolecarboxamide formyltransferase/inosine monophosphate cyclohydrolase [Ktedonobacterales bacterium]
MRAIISVDNKHGIEAFAAGLAQQGVEIFSTGNTMRALEAAGVPVRSIAELTGFPEILGGRVKTLHPAVHAGVLARRDDPAHMSELQQHGLQPIDIVVCNLYPFTETIARPSVTLEEAIEKIDIGGVTLLRAAAKNFAAVTVIARPEDYEETLIELETTGAVSLETRRRLAITAFQITALYDTAIAAYLRRGQEDAAFPEQVTLGLRRLRKLRYGENPHQAAALYGWTQDHGGLDERADEAADEATDAHSAEAPAGEQAGEQTTRPTPTIATVAGSHMLHGKELGYNNLLDLDAALAAVASFSAPTTAIVKHTNPCGLACGDTLAQSYTRAHAGDPVSAYGGIVGFNREVDEATAQEVSQLFYEAIIAPSYSDAALALLTKKKNLRLLATNAPIGPTSPASVATNAHDMGRMDVRRISGGLLIQTADVASDLDAQRTVVTEREPTLEELTDLLFAWKVVRHVKSNAIVLAKNLMVVGVGAGQMSRVYSVQIAVDRAGERSRGSVLASDAYFPFPDSVEVAAKAGVTAIIQPGGSIRDEESIKMANTYGIAMIVTGQRHFRH